MKKYKSLFSEKTSAKKTLRESFEVDVRRRFESDALLEVNLILEHLEEIDEKGVRSAQDLCEKLIEVFNIDETAIVDYSLDEKLDLAIYQELQTGEGCPATSFDTLYLEIDKAALSGYQMFTHEILYEKFGDRVDEFVEKNKLSWSMLVSANAIEFLDSYPPAAQKNIANGSITQYRNLDGSTNIDVYEYHFKNSVLYFKKEF